MRIDYDKIMETISIQFKDILYNDMYYNEFKIHVAKEQDFNRIVDRDPKTIYIVVKFQSASLNYRQYLLPITIYALSEQNKLDACQRLLLDYCMKYNLAMNDDQTIKQFYSSPQVISNFEEIYYGYRSMLYMQGTFLVSKDSDPRKFYYLDLKLNSLYDDIGNYNFNSSLFMSFIESEKINIVAKHCFRWNPEENYFEYSNDDQYSNLIGVHMSLKQMETLGITFENTLSNNVTIEISVKKEEIEILNYQTTCDIMLDSQPFYNTNNFSKSVGKLGTYLINLTAYMVDTPFINKVNAIPDEDFGTAPDGVNTTFTIEISRLKSGKSTIKYLKLVSVSDQGSIGEFPVITMTFSL